MMEKQKIKRLLDYSKELISVGPESTVGKGLDLSLSAVISKTLTKALPAPLNFVVPFVVEKLILLHGVDAGRDGLISALKWVKNKTEDVDLVITKI